MLVTKWQVAPPTDGGRADPATSASLRRGRHGGNLYEDPGDREDKSENIFCSYINLDELVTSSPCLTLRTNFVDLSNVQACSSEP
jgi:hypothetical protein